MNSKRIVQTYILTTGLCLLGSGCCNRVPKGPDAPQFDAAGSGQRAVAQYDEDGDGKISGDELNACPALESALARVDKNSDRAVSADEIADRINYLQTAKTTIITGMTTVTLDGQPLVGATVTFEPEQFLGGAFKACSGVTDDRGVVSVQGHDTKFPGIYLGFYRVRISKQEDGKETLPARYNTESELGYEAADDVPDVSKGIEFHLKI